MSDPKIESSAGESWADSEDAVERRRDDPVSDVVLDGKYELREPLGSGGMGQVFAGRDLRLERDIAVKLLHPRVAEDSSLCTMFRREAAIMANLRHPNVVAVYDTGGWDSCPYLVMPLHRGADLDAWSEARDGPPLDIDVVVGVLGQVCAGVAAMHEAGVVHGDIKPSNILISESREVILVDLGLSRYVTAPLDGEGVGGTPGFLAPELIRREAVPEALVHKADVYALGATAYWLLTGMMPTGSGALSTVLRRQLDGDIDPPSALRSELPGAFDEPILGALCREPAHRIDVVELRDALIAAGRLCDQPARPFVVLVDDDPNALMFIKEVVRMALRDPEIATLTDPRAARSLIESRPPQLVITDLHMPGLSGMELVADLRRESATANVPLIVLTAVGSGGDWQQLRDMGVEYCLLKPVSIDLLHDAVQRTISRPATRRWS